MNPKLLIDGFEGICENTPFGMIRNPLAHDHILNWNMNEQNTLDIFAMRSMIHRKIDIMVLIPKK